jgi:threonine dehydrogenase-like Zn-dependent dehydrogenase
VVAGARPGRRRRGLELTGGSGAERVLECVGLKDALLQAIGEVRDGGVISRVGARSIPRSPSASVSSGAISHSPVESLPLAPT